MLPKNHPWVVAEFERREEVREKQNEKTEANKTKNDKEADSDDDKGDAGKKTQAGEGKWKDMHATLAEKRALP